MMRRYLPFALFVLLVVLLAAGLRLNPRLVPSPLVDKPAPAFDLPTLHDPQQRFSRQDLLGHISLVNIWASWCVSCRAEHATLTQIARSGRVKVYGINYKDERADALKWLAALGNPYLASGFDAEGRVGINWGVYGTPETFLVDQQGMIRYKVIGPVSSQVWEELLLPLIAQLEHP
jgi:cytochrome c biogenesis protein CcmG/thiol:disulfide interchange protein DsbE